MNRALHIAGIAWALTSLVVLGLGCAAIWVSISGAVLFVLLLLLGKGRLPLWVYSAVAAVFLCGCSLFLRTDGFLLRAEYEGTKQVVRGVITDQVFREDTCQMRLRLNEENPVGLRGAVVQIYAKRGVDVWPGDVVEYALQLSAGSLAQAGSKDIDFQAFGDAPRVLGTAETWEVKLSRLRRTMASRFFATLPAEEAAVVSGILLGCGEQIPNTLRTAYAKAGISHLLAVSGMHLTVLLSMLAVLLERSLFSRRQRILIEMALAVAFALLTGLSPSILRAAGMYILCRCAFLFGRDADGLNSLGCGLILILLWNPYGVFSISLQLSYLSTMGICGLSQPIYEGMARLFTRRDGITLTQTAPLRSSILSMLSISLGAQFFTLPLACWYFGRISLVGLLVNLFIGLLGSALLLFGLVAAFFSFFPLLEGTFRLFAFLCGLCEQAITGLVTFFAGLPGASFPLQDDVMIGYLIFWGGLLLLLWYRRRLAQYGLWACCWGTATLAAFCFIHLVFWNFPVTVAVPEYGSSVLFCYGNQAVLLGVPKDSGEAENLIALMEDAQVRQLSFMVTDKEEDMRTYAATFLTRAYPPEKLLHMDLQPEFEGKLFGGMSIQGSSERQIAVDIGGFSIIKSFAKEEAPAHLFVDWKNNICLDSRLRVAQNSRYYQCTRYFLCPKEDEGDGL